jgi:membrane-bound ClpP family serine protease
MSAVLILFAIGIVFLALEIFTPGVVMGVLGGIAMLAGCVLAFVNLSVAWASLVVIAAFVVLGLFLYAEFVILPKSRFGRKFFLVGGDRSKTSQPMLADKEEVVGKMCVTLTALAPSGYVQVDGKRFEAFSQSGFAAKGEALRVVSLDNFRLIVTNP